MTDKTIRNEKKEDEPRPSTPDESAFQECLASSLSQYFLSKQHVWVRHEDEGRVKERNEKKCEPIGYHFVKRKSV